MKLIFKIGMFCAVFSGFVAISSCEDKNPIAEVNGTPLDAQRFEAYLHLKRIVPKDETQKQRILDQYLEREALADIIEKQHILDEVKMTAEIREFEKEMLINRYFEKVLDDKVTDDAVANYYNSHASEYETRQVQVAHILFRTNKNMGETQRKAKLTAAQDAMSKINAGEDFAEVARSTSEDKISGKKGGDLGWLNEGAIDPRFSEKIFALAPGETSEPFETGFGYHIVKHIEGPQVVKQPFEKIKGRIRHQLRNQAKEAEVQRLLSEMDIKKSGNL